MTTQPEPEPEERDASPERRIAEEEMRYPGHGHPEEARKSTGLDEERDPDPEGAPPSAEDD